jgi:Tfp pilus assembly protein PilN
MNDHDEPRDAHEAALQAWDREQKTRKRRAALVMCMALAVGFLGAAVVGRTYGPQAASAQAATRLAQ